MGKELKGGGAGGAARLRPRLCAGRRLLEVAVLGGGGGAGAARPLPTLPLLGSCRLALYVYEYLLHVGAQKSAQTFLSEVSPPAALCAPPPGLHLVRAAAPGVCVGGEPCVGIPAYNPLPGSLFFSPFPNPRPLAPPLPADPVGEEHHAGRAPWLPALLVVVSEPPPAPTGSLWFIGGGWLLGSKGVAAPGGWGA